MDAVNVIVSDMIISIHDNDETGEETHLIEVDDDDTINYVTLIHPKPYDISSCDERENLNDSLKFISDDLQVPIITAVQRPSEGE